MEEAEEEALHQRVQPQLEQLVARGEAQLD